MQMCIVQTVAIIVMTPVFVIHMFSHLNLNSIVLSNYIFSLSDSGDLRIYLKFNNKKMLRKTFNTLNNKT